MNQINPIHIIILLIFFMGAFIIKLSIVKDELVEVKQSYKEKLEISNQLESLSKVCYSSSIYRIE